MRLLSRTPLVRVLSPNRLADVNLTEPFPLHSRRSPHLSNNVMLGVYNVHIMNSREIIREIKKNGWTLNRARGSHHQFVHPTKPGTVTVPHPRRDLTKRLVNSILRQAGLK